MVWPVFRQIAYFTKYLYNECIYLEYHSVCPLVRFWDPPFPLPHKRVCPPSEPKREDTRLQVRRCMGGGVPTRTTGEKAEDTLACGWGGGGESQLGRLEKKPGTLSTLWFSFERVLPVSAGGGSCEGGAPGNAHARCQGTEMWTRPFKIKNNSSKEKKAGARFPEKDGKLKFYEN